MNIQNILLICTTYVTALIFAWKRQMESFLKFLPCCSLRKKKPAAVELQTNHGDASGHDGLEMAHTDKHTFNF